MLLCCIFRTWLFWSLRKVFTLIVLNYLGWKKIYFCPFHIHSWTEQYNREFTHGVYTLLLVFSVSTLTLRTNVYFRYKISWLVLGLIFFPLDRRVERSAGSICFFLQSTNSCQNKVNAVLPLTGCITSTNFTVSSKTGNFIVWKFPIKFHYQFCCKALFFVI